MESTSATVMVSNSSVVMVSNSSVVMEDMNETRKREMWGDPENPTIVALPLSLLYGVIFIAGVFGNVCTCFVIVKHPTMRTATNYYLFSLAISDLLFLVIGLPEEVYLQWFPYPYVFGEVFCIFRALTVEAATNASILVITAFTAERYVAICHPLKAQTMSKLSRSVKIILGIWIAAFALAIPQVIPIGVNQQMNGDAPIPGLTFCGVAHDWAKWSQVMLQISSYLFFLAPMVIISVLYVRLGLQLRKTSFKIEKNGRASRNSQRHDKGNNKSREAVVKMLVAVVIAFFICWAPYHAQRLFSIYSKGYDSTEPDETFRMVHFALTTISGILYYVSATINPILYHILCSRFRVAFKDTFRQCFGRAEPFRRSLSMMEPSTTVTRSVRGSFGEVISNRLGGSQHSSHGTPAPMEHQPLAAALMTCPNNNAGGEQITVEVFHMPEMTTDVI